MVRRIPLALFCVFLWAGCVETEAVDAERLPPHVSALSHEVIVVGETLTFYGEGFLAPDEGQTKLVFEGTYAYEDADGSLVFEKVPPLTIAPLYDGAFLEGGAAGDLTLDPGTTTLRWNRFGPFRVPFGLGGDRPGTFKGTVTATSVFTDGEVLTDLDPAEITLEVGPSLLITHLAPVTGVDEGGAVTTAQCGSPALRGHGGLPYVLEVEAVGFEPAFFIYEVTGTQGAAEWQTFNHTADPDRAGKDRLGDPAWHPDEILSFAPLTDDVEYAIAAIRVHAVDADNRAYHTALPLRIVRPLHFHTAGVAQLAEYYEPEVVFPPIVGSIGTEVTYAETTSESRQQSVSMTVSNSWSTNQTQLDTANWSEAIGTSTTQSTTNTVGMSHSESESASETYGTGYSSSESTNVEFTSTQGSNWGWNALEGQSQESYEEQLAEAYGEMASEVSVSMYGEGSVPGLAKLGGSVGSKLGVVEGAKTGETSGSKQGAKSEYGVHMYESDEQGMAFGSVTTEVASESFSGTYGLQKQSTVSQQTAQTEATTDSTTYTLGGSTGLSQGVTEGSEESWTETWTSSSTDTQLLSYSSQVPLGRCAVIYRQTVRYVRTGHLYSYDLCGVRSLVGELYFNEWLWSPNIVIAPNCDDALPPSTQPPAQCFIACD